MIYYICTQKGNISNLLIIEQTYFRRKKKYIYDLVSNFLRFFLMTYYLLNIFMASIKIYRTSFFCSVRD